MPELAELDPQDAAALLLDEHDSAWIAALAGELDRRLSGRELERILRVWSLSRTELGRMLGVSRQAVSKWIESGVPADRVTQVADLTSITDLLTRYVKRDRIPAVVRREAPNLGDTSLIDLITAGRSAEAVVLTRQMFTFTDAHG
jgi:DNA-binding transcriptional regulator YiaG